MEALKQCDCSNIPDYDEFYKLCLSTFAMPDGTAIVKSSDPSLIPFLLLLDIMAAMICTGYITSIRADLQSDPVKLGQRFGCWLAVFLTMTMISIAALLN